MSGFDPDWTIAPGEILKEWMEERNLTPRVMVTVLARMPVARIEGIIAGTQKITKTDAEALEYGTAIPASLWLKMEDVYRRGLKAGKKHD